MRPGMVRLRGLARHRPGVQVGAERDWLCPSCDDWVLVELWQWRTRPARRRDAVPRVLHLLACACGAVTWPGDVDECLAVYA